MLSRTLLNVGWRYLLRHPWQSVLMILGITLGVAVMVAIDLANVSASQAFDLSTEAVAGRATHQIVGGPQGLDESVYVALRRAGLTDEGIAVRADPQRLRLVAAAWQPAGAVAGRRSLCRGALPQLRHRRAKRAGGRSLLPS